MVTFRKSLFLSMCLLLFTMLFHEPIYANQSALDDDRAKSEGKELSLVEDEEHTADIDVNERLLYDEQNLHFEIEVLTSHENTKRDQTNENEVETERDDDVLTDETLDFALDREMNIQEQDETDVEDKKNPDEEQMMETNTSSPHENGRTNGEMGQPEMAERTVQQTKPQQSITPQQGLLGVTVLNNPTLNASLSYNQEGKPIVVLHYRGEGLINLNLISSTYIIFLMPQPIAEIMSQENMRAFYDVPGLGLLGIEIRATGEFDTDEIQIVGNQVVIRFDQLLSLNLLNYTYYGFDLHMELPYIPYTPSGSYTFVSQATKQIINLSILDDPLAIGQLAWTGTLQFHQAPETISFETTSIPYAPLYAHRKEDPFSISIQDTRGYDAPWRLEAKLSRPLMSTTDESEMLPDALKFRLKEGMEITLTEETATIFSGTTKENPITELTWQREEGPLIFVKPNEVKVGDYQTEIIWTLVDAP